MTGPDSGLADLAASLRSPSLVDLYLERVVEEELSLEAGRVTGRQVLRREGAAVRRHDRLASADGLERVVLASLLERSPATVPAFAVPPFAPAPPVETLLALAPAAAVRLRWRASWAAVLRDGEAVAIERPQLLETSWCDGARTLAVWPPPAPAGPPPPPGDAAPRPGRRVALLAPAAAAVLLHELFAHPLETDLLARGASPWAGRLGERITPLALDLTDDPADGSLPGGFSADDEGVPARSRPLLRGGMLAGALADREGAAALGVPPGSARRAHVHAPPRPRVSNLVASVAGGALEPPRAEAGLEVLAIESGSLEPSSGWLRLAVSGAFSLAHGARVRRLAPFTLTGRVDDVCRGMLAGGGQPAESAAPGWCGKDGEVVPTGARVPWLLVEGLEVR